MLIATRFDTEQWAEDNFANAELGDKRRSKRLVKAASQFVDAPAASTPRVAPLWKDTKAIYRLLDCPDVNLQNVTQTHRDRVQQQGGTQLILSDTTHVDFGRGRDVDGAGPVGPGKSVGFLLHSALACDADTKSLIGVAGQIAHARKRRRATRKKKSSQQGKQWSESRLWSDLFEQVGSPLNDATYIHICDSAADNYETFFTAVEWNCEFVIRCGRANRHAIDSQGKKQGKKQAISVIAKSAEVLGSYELELAQGNSRKARTATLEVAVEPIHVPQPRYCSKHIKQSPREGFDLHMIVVREVNAPTGVKPIHWILLTTLEVTDLDEAIRIIGYYELRWLIEEWHKALKTGCSLEKRQLQDIDRLLPLTGILSVVSVLLLQLRDAARNAPDRPAEQVVPRGWLKLIQLAGELPRTPRTNREVWRSIARLGGFLARRHDGEPGWQTIWRGWLKLHTLLQGVELAKQIK